MIALALRSAYPPDRLPALGASAGGGRTRSAKLLPIARSTDIMARPSHKSLAAHMPEIQLLTTQAAIAECLGSLRPRDGNFRVVEVADAAVALPIVSSLPPWRQLLVASLAGPSLWAGMQAAWAHDAAVSALAWFFREPYLPARPIPALPAAWLEAVQALALGAPGEPVAHGLFPSRVTKLARLLLARAGSYPAELVLDAARAAYGPERSHYRGSYHAHDAVACAVVHPQLDARALLAEYAGHTRVMRGWRSRRKTHRLLAWARAAGYL